jgi:hypothetical protein
MTSEDRPRDQDHDKEPPGGKEHPEEHGRPVKHHRSSAGILNRAPKSS